MKKLTVKEAYALLTDGLEEPLKIQYVTHCLHVGDLAALIADGLGLDAEYAQTLGYLHDVGRRIDPANHAYAGYVFLKEKGLDDYAAICLTHSFLNNDVGCTCGVPLPEDCLGYGTIKSFVETHTNTDYDRIIQTCDLLCTSDGAVPLNERLRDIESRKGRHAGSDRHRAAAQAQLRAFEERLGHPVSDFYGKIR